MTEITAAFSRHPEPQRRISPATPYYVLTKTQFQPVPFSIETERRIAVGHEQEGVGVDAQAPAADTDDEIK